MDSKKKMTGLLIHAFAVTHAVTAAALSQTVVGDEFALTILTTAMIITIAKMNGADWDTGTALAFLGCFIGFYTGTRGAVFLIKWVPGIGNCANAAATFATTEMLGWATFLFVKAGKTDPSQLRDSEKERLWQEAKNLRKKEAQASERLYNSMSKADREEYSSIMGQLKRELPEATRNYLLGRLEMISAKYA